MELFLASVGEVFAYIGYVFVAILVLMVMITVHEAGHYFAGKALGFGIEEFSIGFGPAFIKKKKKDGELFSLRLIPLGGYCAFVGEDKTSDDEKAFNNRAPWKRIIVLISGALMNYLLALLIIIVMFGIYGQSKLAVYACDYEEYAEQSFMEGDVIIKADGKNIYLTTDLMKTLSGKSKGEKVRFLVIRDGEEVSFDVALRQDADFKSVEDLDCLFLSLGTFRRDGEGNYSGGGLYSTTVRQNFIKTAIHSVEYSFKLAGTVFTVLGQLLTGKLGIASMGGTVTTITVTANAVKSGGLQYLLYIASFIGVNLAVFNLLPVPALDGSRVVFTAVEWIRGKPINRKAESIIHTVGFILILLFAVIVDLQKCF